MKITKKLIIVFLIGSILPVIFSMAQEWVNGTVTDLRLFLIETAVGMVFSALVTLSISLSVVSLLIFLQKRFPWQDGISKRLLLEIVLTFSLAIGLGVLFANLIYFIHPPEDFSYSKFLFNFIIISAVMNAILTTITEGIFFFEQWKKSLVQEERLLLETERLEKEKIRAQYETLKTQVDPHFLFNSLNVLSSLVHTDADKAEKFIDEFARIYRYVLEVTEKPLVDMAEELEFVRSYFYLQKIRFGNGLELSVKTKEEALEKKVLPLSVQMMVENAIKHNRNSEDSPLLIRIDCYEDQIVIRNNLQARTDKAVSTGIGLNNLKERYEMYKGLSPEFIFTEKECICKLPIISPER